MSELEAAREYCETKLDDMKTRFIDECKFTLIIRNPCEDDGDLIITDDGLDEVIESIYNLKARDK